MLITSWGKSATTCGYPHHQVRKQPCSRLGIFCWTMSSNCEVLPLKGRERMARPLVRHWLKQLRTLSLRSYTLPYRSPLRRYSAQRRWDQSSSSAPSNLNVQGQSKGASGKGKGGKGKKGKGARQYQATYLPGTKLELTTHTADGQEICYRYNMKGCKCDGKCGRVHVCRVKGCGQHHSGK